MASSPKQLPFSDGKGGHPSVPGRSGPNNFLANPRGSNTGAGTKGVQAASASRAQAARGPAPELNAETMPEGGPAPLLPDVSPQRAAEVGITADGGRKPFKLGG